MYLLVDHHVLQYHLRQLSRLAAASFAGQHDHAVVSDQTKDLVAALVAGQALSLAEHLLVAWTVCRAVEEEQSEEEQEE